MIERQTASGMIISFDLDIFRKSFCRIIILPTRGLHKATSWQISQVLLPRKKDSHENEFVAFFVAVLISWEDSFILVGLRQSWVLSN
jgi:hypothetical protein